MVTNLVSGSVPVRTWVRLFFFIRTAKQWNRHDAKDAKAEKGVQSALRCGCCSRPFRRQFRRAHLKIAPLFRVIRVIRVIRGQSSTSPHVSRQRITLIARTTEYIRNPRGQIQDAPSFDSEQEKGLRLKNVTISLVVSSDV